MYQEQRLEKILTLLEERGNLSVKEMVDALGVAMDKSCGLPFAAFFMWKFSKNASVTTQNKEITRCAAL